MNEQKTLQGTNPSEKTTGTSTIESTSALTSKGTSTSPTPNESTETCESTNTTRSGLIPRLPFLKKNPEKKEFEKKIDKFINKLGKGFSNSLKFALLIIVIDYFFWPELSEEIPIIYQYSTGILTLCEYLVKAPFQLLGGLVSLNLFNEIESIVLEGFDLIKTFFEWIKAL